MIPRAFPSVRLLRSARRIRAWSWHDAGVDWTIVVSGAITGAVGIAGVAGTIIAANIAGNSARQSAGLSIAAEDQRARLADKRRVYARALAALDAATNAAALDRAHKDLSSDATSAKHADDALAALVTADEATSELELIAPRSVANLAGQMVISLVGYAKGESDDASIVKARASLFNALRADLAEEAKRGD